MGTVESYWGKGGDGSGEQVEMDWFMGNINVMEPSKVSWKYETTEADLGLESWSTGVM
jgi:hypothetical protein